MKSKLLLAGSFLLLAAFLLSGCVGSAPTTQAPAAAQVVTKEVPAQFNLVNPRPSRPPIMAVALAPRLSSLEGKTIAIVSNKIRDMDEIAAALPKVASGVKVLWVSDYWTAAGQTPEYRELNVPGVTNMHLKDFDKNPKMAAAVIVGNGH
jgi:hypothetical protein